MPQKSENPRSEYHFISIRLPDSLYYLVKEATEQAAASAHPTLPRSINDFAIRAIGAYLATLQAAQEPLDRRVYSVPEPIILPDDRKGPVVKLQIGKKPDGK